MALFENYFAAALGASHAVAFPYGRSALHALLRILGVEGGTVILPAYTCVVVANAIVHAGCRPRFVDIAPGDVNMDLDALAATIDDDVRVVLATCMHGFPIDIERLRAAVPSSCTVILDGALAMGTELGGRPIGSEGQAAIFGLNLGKQLCSVLGGMATTNDAALAADLRRHREANYAPATLSRRVWLAAYHMAQLVGFWPPIYGLVHWLDEHTQLLSSLTEYYDAARIDMPVDASTQMAPLQARIGIAQCTKLSAITRRRREHARLYDESLRDIDGLQIQPVVDGASYAQYVVRARDRSRLVSHLAKRGVEVATLFDYVVPELSAYRQLGCKGTWPHARALAREVVNLPNYPGLTPASVQRIAAYVRDFYSPGEVAT